MNLATLGVWTFSLSLGLLTLLFILRIVLSWYPQIPLHQWPWCLVAWPTEPVLRPLRRVVPPLGGVDMTPVILVGVLSLAREMLLGQQGLITLALR